MGSLALTLKQLFYPLAVVVSWFQAVFATTDGLHKARFASDHEVADLTTDSLPVESLLVGTNHFSRILHVRATPKRPELGNVLIEAPTGGGKGLLAVCQLLTWDSSAIVFDIKGDLYKQTAGYRQTLGDVFRFDTRGVGNQYDPLQGKRAEDELYTLSKHLLYEPDEGDGKAFTQRGTKMLTHLFLAALALNRLAGQEQYRLLPFVGHMADLGLNSVAAVVSAISPELARRLLDGAYDPEHDYNENKYLASSWGTASDNPSQEVSGRAPCHHCVGNAWASDQADQALGGVCCFRFFSLLGGTGQGGHVTGTGRANASRRSGVICQGRNALRSVGL